jgi:hypothetical protein
VKSGGAAKGEKADARGGKYLLLPHCVLKSEAYRTASPRALQALTVLCLRHSGFNNGRIAMSLADLSEGMANQNHAANSRAVGELVARGLIEVTMDRPKGCRLAREYRITFVPTATASATHDYLHWSPGAAGTRQRGNIGNFRPAVSANETGVSIAVSAKDVKLSLAGSADETLETHANPPFSVEPSFAETAAHIDNHLGASPAGPENDGKTAGGPTAKKSGDVLSAAPPPAELLARCRSYLAGVAGGQTRLADASGVSKGALSKFLNDKGSLNDRARIAVACALPRLETAARKGLAA